MKLAPLFFFLIIFSSALACSQPVEVLRDSYAPGETVTADIEAGSFASSKLSFEDGMGARLSMGILYFKKSEGNYHIYFNLPLTIQDGTYSLRYNDANLSYADNLTVANGTVALSIKPTIFRLDPAGSSIKVEVSNKGRNSTLVNVSSGSPLVRPVRDSIEVGAGEARTLFVNYDKAAGSSYLILSYGNKSYKVELLAEDKPGAESVPQLTGGLEFIDPTPISHSITQAQTIEGELEFRNSNAVPLHNITFHVSPALADIIDFNTSLLLEARPNIVYRQFIWANRNKNIPAGSYSGVLLIKSAEGATASVDVSVDISEVPIFPAREPAELVVEEVAEPDILPLNVTGITDLSNATLEGGIKITSGKAEEEANKNRLAGIILLVVILIIGSIITWKLRPKEKVIKFSDYVLGIGKGKNKKG